ncbi:MAG: cyclase family protein, partial [Thermomicrobiales bacterium]
MPIVTVDWLDGRDPAQKEALAAAITEIMHRIGGSPEANVNVVLNDVPVGNWGRGGRLLPGLDAKASAGAAASGSAPAGSRALAASDLPLLNVPAKIFDLEQPRVQGMPVIDVHQPGYLYVLHRRHADARVTGPPGRRSSASGMIVCMEHSGTHIDAICHQADGGMLFGGVAAADVSHAKGFTTHAVEEIPPIIARGVLLDIAGHRGVDALGPGEAVSAAELQACAAARGIEIAADDVVLVRTGNARLWHDPARYLAGPG